MGLAKELWEATKICTSFGWQASKFIIKNTPATLGMLWEIRKEVSNGIAQSIQEIQKQQKIAELDEKIKALSKGEAKL